MTENSVQPSVGWVAPTGNNWPTAVLPGGWDAEYRGVFQFAFFGMAECRSTMRDGPTAMKENTP